MRDITDSLRLSINMDIQAAVEAGVTSSELIALAGAVCETLISHVPPVEQHQGIEFIFKGLARRFP